MSESSELSEKKTNYTLKKTILIFDNDDDHESDETTQKIISFEGYLNSEGQKFGCGTTFYYKPGKLKHFQGKFINDQKEGHGVLYTEHGKILYEGKWQSDKLHGNGCLYYPGTDNFYYVGNFRENYFDGFGTSYYKNEENLQSDGMLDL